MTRLSVSDACDAAGFSAVLLRNWHRRGMLPFDLPRPGKGNHIELGPEMAFKIALFGVVATAIGPKRAKEALRTWAGEAELVFSLNVHSSVTIDAGRLAERFGGLPSVLPCRRL